MSVTRLGLSDAILPYRSLVRRCVDTKLPEPIRGLAVRFTKPDPWRGFHDDLGVVFIHVPRTGGDSVSAALFTGKDRGHPTAYDFRLYDPDKFSRYFKFAIVRNPWDRLVSSFHRVKYSEPTPHIRAWGEVMFADVPDFFAFANRLRNDLWFRLRVLSSTHFRPQIDYTHIDGQLALDYVGRFEDLRGAFEEIAARLGISATLPFSNQSAHKPFMEYYNPATRAAIADMYAEDIVAFGY